MRDWRAAGRRVKELKGPHGQAGGDVSWDRSIAGVFFFFLVSPEPGPLLRRRDSLEKTLMLGKIESGRGRGRQRMRWLDGITDSMDMSLSNSGSW